MRDHCPGTLEDQLTFMMVSGGKTFKGEMNKPFVTDVAATILSHFEVPIPSYFDGRDLAFNSTASLPR